MRLLSLSLSDRYKNLPIQPILPVFTKASRPPYWGYRSFLPCKNKTDSSLFCDEFPYASSVEGGLTKYIQGKVSLALVPGSEQSGRGQGNSLKAFHDLAGVKIGEKYGVWATYKAWNTAYFTKDRKEGVRFLPPFPLYVGSGLKQKDFENEYAKNNT